MLPSLGLLEKMIVIAYANDRFEDEQGRYSVMINPETYAHSYNLNFSQTQGKGTSSSNLRYNNSGPETLTFDIVFDGTGALPLNFEKGPFVDVSEEIETFKNLILKYQGDIHQPYYVSLVWGSLLFRGRLSSLRLNYKLFGNNGKPLRAVASVSFMGSVEDELRVAQDNAMSPNLTHLVEVKEKETIHQLTNKMYKTPSNYIQVAEVNQLNHFRKLTTGQKISFPPYDNSTAE